MPVPKSIRKKVPVWGGPHGIDRNGGITYSLLAKFLDDREKFRVRTIDGFKPAERFNHRMEYGNMWHAAKEGGKDWSAHLQKCCTALALKYPMDRPTITHWQRVVEVQFPLYLEYQGKLGGVTVGSLCREQVFDVFYALPSGREVRLRGKYDEVSWGQDCVVLDEHKTKGEIDGEKVDRQLTMDLQTMMYVATLDGATNIPSIEAAKKKIDSDAYAPYVVVYNVIRRPLSGGKGMIVRHKATKNKPEETWDSYYARVAQYIVDEPETYFMSWSCEISRHDLLTFRTQVLDPILEQVCDWWDWMVRVKGDPFDTKGSGGVHWRKPRGLFGGDDSWDAVDEYIATGIPAGLVPVTNLFPELQE